MAECDHMGLSLIGGCAHGIVSCPSAWNQHVDMLDFEAYLIMS